MKFKILILAPILALSLVVAGTVLANGGLDLPRWVLGGGASNAAASGVTLRATLGQPLVGIVSGVDITLAQGFWHGGSSFRIYLPLVLRSH